MEKQTQKYIGAIMLPLRMVTAWLFLSAVLRRFILAPGKHEFLSSQWLGHKINTFFPHSTEPFHSGLDFLLQNPVGLDIFTYVFTFSELILGILLAMGFLSRFTGVFMVGLAVGLMHTAGWLGPTCLDEWQIASMLVTIGAVMAVSGSGSWSVDAWLANKKPGLRSNRWWKLMAQPDFDTEKPVFKKIAITLTAVITIYVVGMNQVHHGGLWGPLHNYSKKPGIRLSEASIENANTFTFNAFRDKGPEAYGSFIIKVEIKKETGETIHVFDDKYLKSMSEEQYTNKYVNKIHPGEHSLVIPLGAQGYLTFQLPAKKTLNPNEDYVIEMTEIGGRTFSVKTSS